MVVFTARILAGNGGTPAVSQFQRCRKIVLGQRFHPVIGVGFPEPVEMVPLFLEFPTLQIGQIIDGIHIIVAVPIRVEMELSGVKLLQQPAVLRQQRGNAAADFSGVGVVHNGVQHRLRVGTEDGEGIDAAPVKLGKEYQIFSQKRSFLPSPHIQVSEGIFAAPLAAVHQISVVFGFAGRIQSLKVNHCIHVLFPAIIPRIRRVHNRIFPYGFFLRVLP